RSLRVVPAAVGRDPPGLLALSGGELEDGVDEAVVLDQAHLLHTELLGDGPRNLVVGMDESDDAGVAELSQREVANGCGGLRGIAAPPTGAIDEVAELGHGAAVELLHAQAHLADGCARLPLLDQPQPMT